MDKEQLKRFKEHMFPDKEKVIKDVVPLLKKKCAPFLKEVNKRNMFIWRGVDRKIKGPIERKVTRKNRKPSDTSQWAHERLDELFQEKFGWKVRSQGVFTTPSGNTAAAYGSSFGGGDCIFFPIGKYRYVWSPHVHDLWPHILMKLSLKTFTSAEGERGEIKELRKMVASYTDKGLRKAIAHHVVPEIVFDCKEYYLVTAIYRGIIRGEIYGY